MTAAHSPTRTARRTMRGSARAEGLRGERRDRRHDPHAEHEHHEEHGVRERGGRDRLIAEPADQREIGRHHGDLAELRERKRPRELDRLGQLGAPKRLVRGHSPTACMAPGIVMPAT